MLGMGMGLAGDDGQRLSSHDFSTLLIPLIPFSSFFLSLSLSLSRNYDKALKLLQRATAMPAKRAAYYDKSEPVQNRLFRSLRVWSMYADLEESLGTFEVGHV
jgi:hypothetical protein